MSGQVPLMIRLVQKGDHERLAWSFAENNRPEVTTFFHPFPLNREMAYQIAETSHDDRYYVALLQEEIVGFCMLRGWDAGFEIPSFGVFVDHRYQGCGIGRQMTEFAVVEAKRLVCPGIRLSVYASNERALRLYMALGFCEISREPVSRMGEQDEKIIMVRELR